MACQPSGSTNGPCPNWTFNTSTNQISTSGFTYDAAGNTTGDGVNTYTWDAEGRWSGGNTYDALGQLVQNGATAVYNSSGLAYYRHADWLGSSRFASTPGRAMYYDGAYAPYGENYAETGTTDRNFTGQNQDTTADLYDFLFREDHPTQGRWF